MGLFTQQAQCNAMQSYLGILARLEAIIFLKNSSCPINLISCQLGADGENIIQIHCKLFWNLFKLYRNKVNSQKHFSEK